MLLDPALSVENQISGMDRYAFCHLMQLCPYLDGNSQTTLVHAPEISITDYCNILYIGLPLKAEQKLQQVQNAAARLVSGT